MYRASFGVDDRQTQLHALRERGFGHLTCSLDGRLESVAVPFVVDDALTTIRAHVARVNRVWRSADGAEVLLIVGGPDAYVSPNWYPSKVEHQRVVPTWNYELLHVRGSLTVHDDPTWTADLVRDLTDRFEHDQETPWRVDDAPAEFVERQLRAIVGIEVTVTDVEMKLKLSQNRSDEDRAGVAEGLRHAADHSSVAVAELMRDEPAGRGG